MPKRSLVSGRPRIFRRLPTQASAQIGPGALTATADPTDRSRCRPPACSLAFPGIATVLEPSPPLPNSMDLPDDELPATASHWPSGSLGPGGLCTLPDQFLCPVRVVFPLGRASHAAATRSS